MDCIHLKFFIQQYLHELDTSTQNDSVVSLVSSGFGETTFAALIGALIQFLSSSIRSDFII